MINYKIQNDSFTGRACSVLRLPDGASIPFAPDNTDYTKFKADLANGVALEDATGTAMTADQIKSFMETLP